MSTEKAVSGIEAIELEAERILKEAREQANEILLKANEEANRILSSDPALEGIKAECEGIVQKARKEADQRVEDARVKASGMKAEVSNKIKGIVTRLVNDITRVDLK